ncbi:MAG TPA: sulfite exporter TauE/SafE family protein, partial [bacterium]|nr:sulfite exporter TauE/SafE family protein [bacterium]
MPDIVLIAALTCLVAFIYSSVGHGGASGYLAVLSFFAVPHEQMATSALCLNLFVAGASFYSFYKARYFSWKLTWPFVLGSIPAAFLGGFIKVPPASYDRLLAGALVFAGLRLILDIEKKAG